MGRALDRRNSRPHLVQHLLHLLHSAMRRLRLLLNLAERTEKLQNTAQYPACSRVLRMENVQNPCY